jgi:ribosomal protein S12 methylthiotransferase
MKVKGTVKNKVNVITLGCSKNTWDSEVLMGQLKANKFDVVHEEDNTDASTIIINTCGFIDNAKQESIDTILQFADAKEDGLIDKLYVTGCLSERYKEDLEKEIPQVDEYFGTRNLKELLGTLKADYKKELVGERLLTTPKHFAYFKIAEGCDRPCAFCAIPLMRGKHVSTPIEDLVKQAESLAAKGTKELILIAQDLTYYGLDIYKKRALSELLLALEKVEGIEWIRIHYAYPSGFPMDVIDVMAESKKIVPYIDMPLQHATDNMLKSMKRGITRAKSDKLINDIRGKIPGIALRTTLIVGFPGETEADFEELKQWVRDMKFERLGVFTYSHEENTTAHALEDDVPAEEKEFRCNAIMDIQRDIALEHNQKLVGTNQRIIIDRVEGEHFIGRTVYDSPEVDNEVLIDKDHYVRIGDFVDVTITDCEDFDLYAIPVEK